MSGSRRHAAPLRRTVGRAHAGIVAIGRGAVLAALALAALIPLAALLVLALTPLWGIWTAVTLDGVPHRRRLVEGLQPAVGGWFTQLVNLPTEAFRPLFGDGFFRAVCLVLTALALAVIPLAAPPLLVGIRQVSSGVRTLCGRWVGVPVPSPRRLYPGHVPRFRWLLSDPATWRDLCWAAVNATAGLLLSLTPGAVAVYGALNVLQGLLALSGLPGSAARAAAGLILRGVVLALLGLWSAPALLRGYGLLARLVLARPGTDDLNRRITHLTQTRAETIDAGAAEIRRIERDLHDGAQTRLVAIGMALDAAEQLVGTQPDAARELLRDARGNSALALAELRGLVRGIHPPVLADRGLADAVRALALEAPLPVSVHSDITGRLPAPVESAAYFAVSELLANVAKHANAASAEVRIRTGERLLAITVADDGHGGAAPSAGTGLRGLQRRLAAFDGTLAIDSPPGGPTAITLELPCAS